MEYILNLYLEKGGIYENKTLPIIFGRNQHFNFLL